MTELEVYKKTVDIAADLFVRAGYSIDVDRQSSPEAVKRWLLRKARKELKEEGK